MWFMSTAGSSDRVSIYLGQCEMQGLDLRGLASFADESYFTDPVVTQLDHPRVNAGQLHLLLNTKLAKIIDPKASSQSQDCLIPVSASRPEVDASCTLDGIHEYERKGNERQ